MNETCPDEFVEFAGALADAAAGPIGRYFQNPEAAPVERKADGSPFTHADKEGETAMRELIASRYPDHGIRGEEFPPENDGAEFVWVLDPVDGTNGFITASPMFTTTIALLHGGHAILGVINSPILGWRWVGAQGRPTMRDGRAVNTRACPSFKGALVCCASPAYLRPADYDAWLAFARRTGTVGYGSYTHGAGFVAEGLIDFVVEGTMAPHDYLAYLPIIEGAGGVVTNWEGDALGRYPIERLLGAGDRHAHE